MTSTARCLPSISRPGGDAAHELRHLVEPLRLGGRRQRVRDRFLDARHVDDALAQHGFLDQPELLVGGLAVALAPSGASGRIWRSSCASRLSSTAISAAATPSSAVSSGGMRRSTIAFSASSSPSTRLRSAPRPSTPSVSLILRSISSCGARSSTCVAPLRTKMSRTSLTRVRSSRIAAATVA